MSKKAMASAKQDIRALSGDRFGFARDGCVFVAFLRFTCAMWYPCFIGIGMPFACDCLHLPGWLDANNC